MALVLVGILGLGTVVTDVLALTTLQRLIPSDHLARVFGILDSLLVGANVLGAAVTAWLVGVVGIRATLVAIGVAPAIAVVGVAGLARRRIEPGAVDLSLLRPAVDLLAGLPMLRTASITSIEALAAAAAERSMPPGTEADPPGGRTGRLLRHRPRSIRRPRHQQRRCHPAGAFAGRGRRFR